MVNPKLAFVKEFACEDERVVSCRYRWIDYGASRFPARNALPSGPTWDIVQEILDVTAGDHPTEIRDHALSMLFAIYGVRPREVARLRFSDIHWDRDRIIFTRSKGARRDEFPLSPTVGAAIIRYIKEARQKSSFREIFLTRHAPVELHEWALRR
jgi:integrase/recombinase XerD